MIQVLNQTFQRKNQVDWGEPVQPDLSTKLCAWHDGAYLPRERAGQLHPGESLHEGVRYEDRFQNHGLPLALFLPSGPTEKSNLEASGHKKG